MARNRLSGLSAALLLLLANIPSGGCAKTSGVSDDIVFSWQSDPAVPHTGTNIFTATLADKTGVRLTGAHIALEGDMTHPGMTPSFGEAKEIAPGRYQGQLDLSMPGDWTILFHITLASGQ